nr:uncharacterized protein LOC117609909 [Osmia lignaria]
MIERLQLEKDLSTGLKNSLTARIARFKSLRAELHGSVKIGEGQRRTDAESHASSSSSLIWEDVESAFHNRIITGIIINTEHIEPRNFLEDARKIVFQRLAEVFQNHSCIKVNTVLYGEFTVNNKSDVKSFSVRNKQLFSTSNLNDWYDKYVVNSTLTLMEEFQERDSGWAISKILHLMLNINKCNPMHAGCYTDIPKTIKDKRAVVNVTVDDDTCFVRSIVAALYPAHVNANRPSSYPNYDTVLNLEGIAFPITLNQIPKFERQNDVSINVYFWDLNVKRCAPLQLTTNKRFRHVNLLMLEMLNRNVRHFAWIKNLSRLVSNQLSAYKSKTYICDRCLHYFYAEEMLLKHTKDCMKMNDCAIILPSSEDKIIKFDNFCHRERHPFIVYADFECMLKKVNSNINQGHSNAYQQHEAYSVEYYFHCSYNASVCEYRAYRGPDCAEWFVNELENLVRKIAPLFNTIVPMTNLTGDERESYMNATHCYICEKPFNIDETKVRDHCHFTGRYQEPAHQGCNLNYTNKRFIPIVFHNLSGYDAYFVIKEFVTIAQSNKFELFL